MHKCPNDPSAINEECNSMCRGEMHVDIVYMQNYILHNYNMEKLLHIQLTTHYNAIGCTSCKPISLTSAREAPEPGVRYPGWEFVDSAEYTPYLCTYYIEGATVNNKRAYGEGLTHYA